MTLILGNKRKLEQIAGDVATRERPLQTVVQPFKRQKTPGFLMVVTTETIDAATDNGDDTWTFDSGTVTPLRFSSSLTAEDIDESPLEAINPFSGFDIESGALCVIGLVNGRWTILVVGSCDDVTEV